MPVSAQAVDPERDTKEQHYETLFRSMSEGFALCEPIRDADGRFVDYVILEINPALQAMLGVGPEAAGTRLSDGPADPRWFAVCAKVLETGVGRTWEFHNAATERWHEIRVSRVGRDRLAQFFFDITERKAAQARQARLFDELNHRVKNNLAMVASILQLQARGAPAGESAGLLKAVDRLASVSAVHESLYSGGRREDVDLGDYLTGLCERLSDALIGDDDLRIEVAACSVVVSVEQAAPLGMIVNELVTNAVKYAYPGGHGVIAVSLVVEGEETVLTVADRGVGLPLDGHKGRTGGLGMRVVSALVSQIGGVLDYQRGEGSRFSIRFPPTSASAPTAA